jgi:hypothetical protein
MQFYMHFYMYAIFRVFPMRQPLSTTEKGQQNGGGESAPERRPDQPPLGPSRTHPPSWTAYGIRFHLLKLGDSGQKIPFVLNGSLRLQAPKMAPASRCCRNHRHQMAGPVPRLLFIFF